MTAETADWRLELEALAAEGKQLRAEAEALQKELAQLVSVGEHGAVTVTLDTFGRLVEMQIDAELREEATSAELVREINLAMMRSRNALATQIAPRWPTDADALTDPVVNNVVDALRTGMLPEPEDISNDLGTVTVSAMWGTIVRISCDLGWIEAASEIAICDEIVRVARLATEQSDVLGRGADGENDD